MVIIRQNSHTKMVLQTLAKDLEIGLITFDIVTATGTDIETEIRKITE